MELLKGVENLAAKKPSNAAPEPIAAFVSYSPTDAKLKAELIKHLAPLDRLKLVSHWDHGAFEPHFYKPHLVIPRAYAFPCASATEPTDVEIDERREGRQRSPAQALLE